MWREQVREIAGILVLCVVLAAIVRLRQGYTLGDIAVDITLLWPW